MSVSDLVQGLLTFFVDKFQVIVYNIVYIMFLPLNKLLFSSIPNFDQYVPTIITFFDALTSILKYCLDMCFINSGVFLYFVFSVVYAIGVKTTAWTLKIIVKWWHYLVP